MITLPIQIGREYVRRDGKVVKAIRCPGRMAASVEFQGHVLNNEGVYLETGRFRTGDIEHAYDLVADCFSVDVTESEPHPHAASMALYAQDATETGRPWLRWQYQNGDGEWTACRKNPIWDYLFQYRRAPRTLRIGAFVVPDPLRTPPVKDTPYYVPSLSNRIALWATREWWDDATDREYLRRGLVHLSKDAAEQHARALLSFTETPT